MEVNKKQHKYVIGPKGSGLQEILSKFDTSVEVPPLDDPSTTITLRGTYILHLKLFSMSTGVDKNQHASCTNVKLSLVGRYLAGHMPAFG